MLNDSETWAEKEKKEKRSHFACTMYTTGIERGTQWRKRAH